MTDNETVSLIDQVTPDTSVTLDYNVNKNTSKVIADYDINSNTKVEVSDDNKGDINANLTVKF